MHKSIFATLSTAALLALPSVSVYAQSATVTQTLLHVIDGNTDGYNLFAPLIFGADGNLYGTAQSGPASVSNGGGTVFRVSPATGGYATVHQFVSTPDQTGPFLPYGPLLLAPDGTFYSTASVGGTVIGGTVFRLTNDGTLTNLTSFNVDNRIPHTPYSGVIFGQDGELYGTLYRGGPDPAAGDGAVYRVNPDGTGFAILHQFSRTIDGTGQPEGALVQAASGWLFGLTHGIEDGIHNAAVYSLNPDGSGFQVVHTFGYSMHNDFNTKLLLASDGNFYGATQGSGSAAIGDAFGSIFRLTPDGVFTTLHSFDSTNDGYDPLCELIQGQDGRIYGTVRAGGTKGYGNVFRFNLDGGGFEKIYDYTSGTGMTGEPMTGLVQGSDGAFYGVANRPPAIYKLVVNAAPIVTVVVTTPTVTVGSGSYAQFTLSLSAAQDHDVLVNYTVKGSGINGTDYVYLKGVKKIKAGKTSKPIKVLPLGNLGGDSKKTVTLFIVSGDGYSVGTTVKQKVKILAAP